MNKFLKMIKKIVGIVFFGLVVFIYSYYISNPLSNNCNDFEKKVLKICVQIDTLYSIPLDFIDSSEWEYLYIIEGPKFQNEITKIIGLPYQKTIPDSDRVYFFVKNAKIIKIYEHSCLRLYTSSSSTIGKYTKQDSLRIKKTQQGKAIHFRTVD